MPSLITGIILFSILIILVITVTELYRNTPYIYQYNEIPAHAITHTPVAVTCTNFHVKTVIGEQLDQLTSSIINILMTENIQFWAVNRTLLGLVRHGCRIPWDDYVEFAVLNSDLVKLVKLRTTLRGTYTLIRDTNGYRYTSSSTGYPSIKLYIMDRTDDTVMICTPHNEIGHCLYEHNQHREIFSDTTIFPLTQLPYKLEYINQLVHIPCAAKYEQCLVALYGHSWEKIDNCPGPLLQWINNNYTRTLLYRFTGLSGLV